MEEGNHHWRLYLDTDDDDDDDDSVQGDDEDDGVDDDNLDDNLDDDDDDDSVKDGVKACSGRSILPARISPPLVWIIQS